VTSYGEFPGDGNAFLDGNIFPCPLSVGSLYDDLIELRLRGIYPCDERLLIVRSDCGLTGHFDELITLSFQARKLGAERSTS